MADFNGYYQKYRVIQISTGEEISEPTFTIKLESDPHAEAAILAYADSVEDENPQLAEDLRGFYE